MIEAPWTSLAALLAAWILAVILPGPNFVATVHASCAASRGHGLRTAAGIAVGTALWTAFSLVGLGAAMAAASWFYQALRLAGAAYLIFVGCRMVVSAVRGQGGHAAAGSGRPCPRPFRQGLSVVLSNPKTAAFFTSLFAVAVPAAAPVWFKALCMALVVGVSWSWYSLVACAVCLPRVEAALARVQRPMALATGGLLVFFGLRLAAER
ncbi:LysE family transporter [Desulfocurvus sp. DL9XJH121]